MATRIAEMPPIKEHLEACTMCGYCVPVCPAYQELGFESAAPRGKVFFMREYERRGWRIVDLYSRIP